MMEQGFLDVNSAAQFLNISTHTLRKWVCNKTIPYRKHGTKLAFSQEDLSTWSEGKKIEENHE